jgi:hypothetical protein
VWLLFAYLEATLNYLSHVKRSRQKEGNQEGTKENDDGEAC